MRLVRGTRWRAGLALAATLLATPRALALSVRTGFTATPLVTGLDQPTAAAFAPDGRLVVLEKGGAVRLWTAGGGLRTAPLLTLPVCTASEMGLLGVAFDPQFATTRHLYLYHTQPPGGDPGRCGEGTAAGRVNRIVRVTLEDDSTIDPASLAVLLSGIRTDGGNHDGGGLRFGPDGFLYAGVGDTGIGDGGPPGASTNPYAQDLQRLEGKILRLARDGSPAPDNPFAAQGGNAAYVWARGLRNPFRLAFDPIVPGPRLLWVGDVGQGTFEEIDVVRAGDDLGWPRCEGFAPMPQCPGASVPPVYVYRHPGNQNESVSVTGGVHYDGTQFEDQLRGDYFFGDYGLGEVYRAEVDPARTGIMGDVERFSADAGGPVDFLVGPDGALYWVAIGLGAVVRVTQDGRPGAAIGGCERALGRAAASVLPRAARRLASCLATGRTACGPRRVSPRGTTRRRVRAACDAAARARVCARLGCVPCESVQQLLACVGDAAAETTARLAPSLGSAPRGRCRTAAVRSLGRSAGDRLGASVACAEHGATACVPPPIVPEATTRGLARACRTPAPEVCAALACGACATAPELASCAAARVAVPTDALGAALLGVIP